MKKTKVDMNPERQIITNMIVSDQFLREITPIFRSSLLKTEYAREVATWIEEYWNQYKSSPGKDIQNIWHHKKGNLGDEEEAENIADFLGRLSSEWEQNQVTNVKFATICSPSNALPSTSAASNCSRSTSKDRFFK